MSGPRVAWAVLRKDLLLDLRSRDRLGHMMLFAAVVVTLLSISLPPVPAASRSWSPTLVWIVFLLTSLLGLSRSFQSEIDAGALQTLAGVPCNRGWIFAGKVAANWLTLAGLQLWTALLFGLLLGVPWLEGYAGSGTGGAASEAGPGVALWAALGITWLGAGGLSSIGTLFSAIAAQSRNREFLLPLLLLPLLLPVLVVCARALMEALESRPIPGLWWSVLGLYVWVFLLTGFISFDYVLED